MLIQESFTPSQLIAARKALLAWYGRDRRTKDGQEKGLKGAELTAKVNAVMRNQFGDACKEIEIGEEASQ